MPNEEADSSFRPIVVRLLIAYLYYTGKRKEIQIKTLPFYKFVL